MKVRNWSPQIFLIFAVITAAFVSNTLIFSALNTDSLRAFSETEARMFSSFLVKSIEHSLTPEEIRSEPLSGESLRFLFPEEPNSFRARFRITAPDGRVLFDSNGEEASGFPEFPDNAVLEEARSTGSAAFRSGRKGVFFLAEDCCVVRPLYNGAFFLTLTHQGRAFQAMQRRQLILLLGLDLILMGIMVVLIVNIITKYRREILRYATTDELTGLCNRKSFNAVFTDMMSAEHPPEMSLFLLDIDFFKQINDKYGHAAGDHALQLLSERIQAMVRKKGGFAGRWGGDEFIGVLPLPGEEAWKTLCELCGVIEGLEPEEGFRMTISAGVSPVVPGMPLAKLSEQADSALYESKEAGRNRASLYSGSVALSDVAEAAKSTVEKAIVHAESLVIPKKAAERLKSAAPAETRFRKRFMGYIREHLIRSTILGVRWMAPFVAGGGILIGLAFLFDAASLDLSALSMETRAQFGSITTTAALLNRIGSTTFNFMLPIFAGFMAYGISGEAAFMAGFVGGYMTIDTNSGFIGAIIAGFAAGVITGEIEQFTGRLPKFIRKAAPIVIYPVFNLLLMELVSWLAIGPVSRALGSVFTALLNLAVQTNPVTAGAFSGAMMATDMGGILNKVAYQYGVNGISSGNTDMMASVMAGGMVPPIGIFLSMALFRGKYSEHEWERGPGTLFMGLSFITEGALPYVFTDVFRVIPSCMAGAAVAGALSTLFGCRLPAPHGGIFVLPVMERPLLYLLALGTGSLVTAVLLGLWKKEVR
ncbi:MAG: diguanylate cyclase [Oscillibacter sp.]|nr:diguanylate cyclase [Oscillibacter sp.]